MFRQVHRRLTLICSLLTTGIVLVILLFCLFVSEKNMYRAEEALFSLKANSVSFDLVSGKSVDRSWYGKNNENGHNILYIEINGKPSPLTSALLSDDKTALISRVKNRQGSAEAKEMEDFFSYKDKEDDYMVMSAHMISGESRIDYLYLHSLADFHRKIIHQRVRYFFIWLASAAVFFVFSYFFTAQTMKPLIKNQEKQKQFVSLASHELRSPLAVFKTGLSLLKNNPEQKPERASRIHSMMEGEIGRMERLLNDLLLLSKAEQSALSCCFREADLTALLASVYDKYLPIAQQHEITLSLDEKTPSALYCMCDIQRIEQVVIILLDNALTYTPAGGRVILSGCCSYNKCMLSVRDTGTGIPDKEKDKIFDRFYQADSSHNSKEHFGLGLSIAHEICRAHHGTLSVSDAPGGGSIFTVRLPQSAL